MGRDLDGNVVLVAGATGGLGRQLVAGLADRGATVVGLGREAGRLGEVDRLKDHVVADLADPSAPGRAVAEVVERHGRLDGVVNAAGVVAFGPTEELDLDVLQRLFEVNVLGPLRLVRAALPHLDGGFVVNLSAVVAEQPMAGLTAYSASKAALSAAGTALQREVRRRGIHVLDVRPPHTETGLADRPIAGEPPKLPTGKDPRDVVERILAGVVDEERDLPSTAF